jgi:quercetin dioxygenase-like cupin family protein
LQAEEAVMTGQQLRIYRGSNAPPIMERARSAPGTSPKPRPATVEHGLELLAEAGWRNGARTKILLSTPALHITHVWFKSGFPLPLHSHDADCHYQFIGGSVRFGTETLVAGDGIFIPANTPYTLTPGPDGVELIETRTQDWFDTHYRTENPDFWERLAKAVRSMQTRWADEPPPVGGMQPSLAVTA